MKQFMQTSMAGICLLFCLGLSATAQASGKTQEQVFSDLLTKGMPVEQAVAGVLTNSPEYAEIIVTKALQGHPDSVFDITDAALKAAPDETANIISAAVEQSYLQTKDIINAVAQQAPRFTANTVTLLLEKNAGKDSELITQAAAALSLVELKRNQRLRKNDGVLDALDMQ